ncbi:hypothetical protein LVO79_11075 [Roseivivax marinus]|uniref:calcium-binding protein n=1 Tax=Roseivivax marinus TaxID=1379903 RepID=UPI001F0400E9|nr:calcium-binding protein [Roseivivax marinus]UMA63580.1 hypothetical protein LVO79_11075 [Roseivivax marinus]
MQELTLESGNISAAINDDQQLDVDLTRFGEIESTYSLDVSTEAVAPDGSVNADNEFFRSEVLDLTPDGTGGAWVIVGRYYGGGYSGFNEAELVAVRLDDELEATMDVSQLSVEGDFSYEGFCAICEDYDEYPPLVEATVLSDGDLAVAIGASPSQASDYDALPLHLARLDGATGGVEYLDDTGLRGEPAEVSVDTADGQEVIEVRSYVTQHREGVITYDYHYDFDLDRGVLIPDFQRVTRHDAETGELLGTPEYDSPETDAIFGYEDEDNLTGTSGNDNIFGFRGADRIDAGAGDDIVFGGGGLDVIALGAGDDLAYGGNGNDHLAGASGDDILSGGTGNDVIGGGEGKDSISGGSGNDTVRGGQGADSIRDDSGDNVLTGGYGNDTISGSDGANILAGGFGIDRILGGTGNDTIGGGHDRDFLFGGGGEDVIYGGQGDDRVEGRVGNDEVNGGYGDDTVNGGHGDDRVNGGPGNDFLRGDEVNGDDGLDVFVFSRLTAGETDYIADFGKFDDRIEISGIAGETPEDQFAQLDTGFAIGSDGEAGAYVRIEGHTIILDGFFPGALTSEDFLFV